MSVLSTLLQQVEVVIADSSLCAALHPLRELAAPVPPLHNHATIEKRDQYLAAGARLFLTNTFDAGRLHLEHIGMARAASRINEQAVVQTKRLLADVASETLVAGSIGLLPNHASHAEHVNAIAEQVEALANGGADLLWAESLSSLSQIDALLAGCQLGAPQLDLVVTLAFRPDHNVHPFKMTPTTAVAAPATINPIPALPIGPTRTRSSD